VPYGLKVAIFTEPNKGSTIRDPRRTVILLLFNYAEMIFWFAACYSILAAKGLLEIDDEGPKVIVLLRESVMSMVANSSDAFEYKSDWAWFVVLVQNVLGLIMTIVIATRFISFLPPVNARRRQR
jgi:hypothetical protein